MYIHIYTAEVQPPCCIGWFPNHYYLSRVFFIIIQKGTSIFNMVSDFQGKYIISIYIVCIYTLLCNLAWLWNLHQPCPDGVSLQKFFHPFRLRYLIFYQSDQLVSYLIANLENSWGLPEENKTKQNKQTPTPLHQMHVFEDLSSCPYTSWAGHLTNAAWPLMATCCPYCRNLVAEGTTWIVISWGSRLMNTPQKMNGWNLRIHPIFQTIIFRCKMLIFGGVYPPGN